MTSLGFYFREIISEALIGPFRNIRCTQMRVKRERESRGIGILIFDILSKKEIHVRV